MAQIESSSRNGRSINQELNLVPFIDLMSVLITFLLISAVWTQVSMIQLGTSFVAPRDPNLPPPPVPANEDVVLKLDVVESGYSLKFGKDTIPIPKVNENYDNETLITELKKAKAQFPEKVGIKVSISDQIKYENVIEAMDSGLAAGFSPELLTGGPN